MDAKMEEVEIDLDEDLYNKIVEYLGTTDSKIISGWIGASLETIFAEYLDKEKG